KGDPGRKVAVARVPEPPKERADISNEGEGQTENSTKEGKTKDDAAAFSEQTPGAAAAKVVPLADNEKLKVDYYQTVTAVSLTIYVKDTDKEKLDIKVHSDDVVSKRSPACKRRQHP